MHTFFFCPFAQKVWDLIPTHKATHLTADKSFKDAITIFRKVICLPPSEISGNILPWVCWALWTARNTFLFEDQTFTPQYVASKALRLAQEWNLAQRPQNQVLEQAKTLPKAPHLHLDRSTKLICKMDAAWNKQSNKASLAWIFTDSTGACKNRGATTQEFVPSPLIAEALALQTGITTAVAMGITDLQMLSDNSTLVRAINNDL